MFVPVFGYLYLMPLTDTVMNALRQIVSPQNGRIWIDLPKEFSQKRFEVIVLPVEEPDEEDLGLPPHLNTSENRLKVREKEVRSARLRQAMDAVAAEAAANGLTEEILNEILNDPD